jgi:hypothetical protein
MANKSKKVSVSYRLESEVVSMIKFISRKENRKDTNTIETIVKQYYNNMEENKMKTIITVSKGFDGDTKKIEVYSKNKIIEIIENLDDEEVIRKAWRGFNKGYKSGYAAINVADGELQYLSLGQNESFEGIENYVILYRFDQNFDIGDMQLGNIDDGDEIAFEDEKDEIEAMFEELLYQDNIIDMHKVNMQLEQMYNK